MSESTQTFRSDCSEIDVLRKTKTFVKTRTVRNFVRKANEEFIVGKILYLQKCSELWTIDLQFNEDPNYLIRSAGPWVRVQFDATVAGELTYDYFQLYVYTVDKSENEHKVHDSGKLMLNPLDYIVYNVVSKDFMLSEESDVLVNGDLILKFELVFTKFDMIINYVDSPSCPLRTNSSQFAEYDAMMYNEKFSDANIIVAGKAFPVHKVILSTRSPVFAAMFQHEMKESRDNKVEIEDTDEETVRELLSFIYTGRVNDVEAVAFDLMAAANKYQIEQLKVMCETALVRQLKVDNVIPLLTQAVAHDADKLKSSAMQFFKQHAKEVVQTKSFDEDLKALIKLQPEIVKAFIL